MGKVISFPKKQGDGVNNLVFMQAYIKSTIIDLSAQRRELSRISKELREIKRRLELRLVKNESGPDTA